VNGAVPDHEPGDPVKTWPATALPEIVGGDEFAGGDAPTTAVGADVAVLEPALFDAVTTTRIVDPTSAADAAYDEPVAPGVAAQLAPPASQRCHWYA
jgi:hypothetical protein